MAICTSRSGTTVSRHWSAITRSTVNVALRQQPLSRRSLVLSQSSNRRYSTKPTAVYTKKAMAPVGPYSQATITPVSPQLVFCSGQLPATADGALVTASMGEKTEACIAALKAVLEEAGSSLDKIVKTTVFLTDMADFAEMNAVYEKLITHKPARSCVAVKQLPKGVNLEIECVAFV